jgi:cytoskeleton protein RodZ
MSEPQHPQPHDTETHKARPVPAAAPSALHAAAQAGGESSSFESPGFESLKSVGARLTQLREAKALSIDDVSARLKVPAIKLQALEAGDLSHLPDTTFVLGVVRSYAKMLGADPAPFVQALRREKGLPEPALMVPASAGADLRRGKVSLSLGSSAPRHRSWLWGVAAAVVAFIALVMWHTNGGDSSAWLARLKALAGSSAGGSTSVAGGSNGASATVAQGQTSASMATADEGATGASGTQAAADEAASQTPMPTPLPMTGTPAPGAPMAAASTPTATTTSAAPQGTGVTPAPAVAASAAQLANAQAAAAGASTVALKVTQDSWFSVRQKDGKELFSGLVHAGETKEISGAAPFKVTLGNKAGLESMTLDGQPVDPAKYAVAKGNVARFALP